MNRARSALATLVLALIFSAACQKPAEYDLILRGGDLYDGSGGSPRLADIAIRNDTIVAIGDLSKARGKAEIDARGLAVAPGFINMMSQAGQTLIVDGKAQSDIRQGITLEVLGEGDSMGPLSPRMKDDLVKGQGEMGHDIEWTTLDEFLGFLENRGVSPNVASFIGAATPRVYAIGYDDRPPTEEELSLMQRLVGQAMEAGALGVASALIYPPGSFAKTAELVALAKVAAQYGGLYISHIRSEGDDIIQATGEFLRIVRESGVRGEIFHLKTGGRDNWAKMDQVIEIVKKARAEGLEITADAYPYAAGMAGLMASFPPWIQDGGVDAAIKRMKDPATRQRIIREMREPAKGWESLYLQCGSPDRILLISFNEERLKPLTGKTLAQAAEIRGKSPEETAMDLLIEDNGQVLAIYFSQSEENLKKTLPLPWLSFCTDESAYAAEGIFLESGAHPRAYGTYPRILGKYVRDEKLMTLQEAIRKMSALPAETLRIERRGRIQTGYFADIVVFDPDKVRDLATYENPHRYATGIVHVLVNGVLVLRDGEHTGAKPGRVVRGPGARARTDH
ncbi:MAG: D-aminoacylase [Candidatus Aminicenantes bacterium]|nr:D-aminoacylase [Candidatus Aminicenantes bacterium]